MNYYISLIERKAKTVRRLLSSGDLKTLNVGFKRNMHIIAEQVKAIPYYVFADLEDRRYGGKCTNRIVKLRHYNQGANDLQNTDYRCIEQLFKTVPLRPDDVFVDVGCGEARVITWHDRHGFRGRLIGVELDKEVASRAARRAEHCENALIINKSILDCSDVIRDGTAYFLFNPFNWEVLKSFLEMIEKNGKNGVRLYYLCDYGRHVIDNRKGWNILWRGTVSRPPWKDLPATIYEYNAATKTDR